MCGEKKTDDLPKDKSELVLPSGKKIPWTTAEQIVRQLNI
jgi:hypothetical protein